MRFVCVPLVVLIAGLAGCATASRETRAVYEPATDVTSSSSPMAQISPSAGEVVSVVQSQANALVTQRIVLKGDAQTPGENQIVIKVDLASTINNGALAPVPKPTEDLIQGELQENFPDFDMRLSTTWNRNSFGPFGYAIGHPTSAVTCVYAWQYQGLRVLPLVGSPGVVASSASLPAYPTSVRVRLCKAGMGEQEIVAMLRDMVVYAPGSSLPYADPNSAGAGVAGARDALAASGVPGGMFLAPRVSESGEPVVVSRHRRAHVARVARIHYARVYERPHGRRRHLAYARPYEAPSAEEATGVNVPLPGGGPAPSAPVAGNPASNPLLAPLQSAAAPPAPAARAAPRASNDMPLPPRAAAAPRVAAPVAARAPSGTVPLPN
jgi:hypothetical protein